ncbi:MAG: hypothetical protein KAJ24_03395, partial [Candidatus Aenigmarchaeota archaeon]|nr:hypothetical protein [Candidatus Aenigmarchaeota archaeon]
MKVQSVVVISIISILLMGSAASAGWFTDLFKSGNTQGNLIQNDPSNNPSEFVLQGKHADKKMDKLISSSTQMSLK